MTTVWLLTLLLYTEIGHVGSTLSSRTESEEIPIRYFLTEEDCIRAKRIINGGYIPPRAAKVRLEVLNCRMDQLDTKPK